MAAILHLLCDCGPWGPNQLALENIPVTVLQVLLHCRENLDRLHLPLQPVAGAST